MKRLPLATRIQKSAWFPALLTLAAFAQVPASAQSTWNAGTGVWSSDFNWNPAIVPLSDPTTHLAFGASGNTSYTTTNDIGEGPFVLNRITVNHTGTGTVTITGATTANTFSFDGANPTLDITGNALFTGLMVGTATITKTGPGTFIHDSNNGGFTGTVIINQGTFVNRSTAIATTNFNPVSIVVNDGGTYQFGAATVGNPNIPNSTFITVNTGGTVNWQEGEDFGGFHLQGGTINLQQGNANANGSAGAQIWTTGTLTGGNFIMGGTNAINKTGPGTVFVTGNVSLNTTAGGLNILEGTLSLANAANLGTTNVSLGDGGSTAGTLAYHGVTASKVGDIIVNPGGGNIEVSSATTILTLTGAISGNGILNKTGPGKLRLTGSLGSSGATNIAAGVLQVEPVAAFGSFIVSAGTTLAVNSGIGVTSFMPTSVNLADGATLQFDLDTNALPTAPLAVISDFDGVIRTGTSTLKVTNLQAFANGIYSLLDYDGAQLSSGFNLALPGRTQGTLIYDTANTRIDVSITGTDTVKWTGAINGVWDAGTAAGIGGTNNWKLVTAGTSTNFIDTDSITFDDTATNYAVNLTTTVLPTSITVDAATNYTFSGTGKLSGATALNKFGSGTLILATDNDYTGGTTVTGGILQLGNGGTTGSVIGNVNLNGGALAFNRSDNYSFNNAVAVGNTTSVTHEGTGIVTISTPLVTGSNTVDLGGAGSLTMGATVSGTGIINKVGAGTLTLLANNNTFTGTLNVNAGTVLLDDLGAGGDLGASSIVIGNTGTFILGPTGNVDFPDTTRVTISSGGLFRIEQGENYGGVVLDGGELRFVSATRTGVNSTAVTTVAGTTVYDFRSGTITTDFTAPGAGGALNQGGDGVLTKTTTGTVTISGGVTFQNALAIQVKEGTLSMGLNNVPANGAGLVTLGDATTTGMLQINGAGSAATIRPFRLESAGGIFNLPDAGALLTVNGTISGPGALFKAGNGTLVLSSPNDYFGTTAVSSGTLEVTNLFGSATGTGPVAITGTLSGDGSIATGAGNSISIDGTFQLGFTGATQGTDFSVFAGVGGNTVFGPASVARFDLWSTTGTDQSANPAAADLLLVTGGFQIAAGSTLKLTNPNALSFQDGDVFRLFDWTNVTALTGTWIIDATELGLGDLNLDTSNLYTNGTIGITAIPEPGSALLLIFGVATCTIRRRHTTAS